MSTNSALVSTAPISIFQIVKPIRGIDIDLTAVRKIYTDLAAVVQKEGHNFISKLNKPNDATDEVFANNKNEVLQRAFKVTVTIKGIDGADVYGESVDVFNKDIMPVPVTAIFMTNKTAYTNYFKTGPQSEFSLFLDFGKPPIFDWSSFVSSPTSNNSSLSISGFDTAFVRSVESAVMNLLQYKRSPWKFLHAPFVYDCGLWFVAIPYIVYLSTKAFNGFIAGHPEFQDFKFAIYIYFLAIVLIGYRILFSYIKWVYPVNVFSENNDRSNLHRAILYAVLVGLLGKVIYDLFLK